LSVRWAETGGVKVQVLKVHIEAARKDNSKGGDWAMLEWTDVGTESQRYWATKATELLDSLFQDLGKDVHDSSLFCGKLESVDVRLKALHRPELKELHGELNSIKKIA